MRYFSSIKGVRESENKTEILLHIPGELQQEILKYKSPNKNYIDAELKINDKRLISVAQRKKIYATINDIAVATGNPQEPLKEFLKYDYMAASGDEYFSLSDCSINTARNFITHLIDFVLKHDLALTDLGLNRTDDIDKYLYSCIKYRKCCITGLPADIHHVEGSRVGMGRNRKTISHNKLEIIALNRVWHDKVHREGEKDIFEKYKIYGIKVDKDILEYLGLNYKDIS